MNAREIVQHLKGRPSGRGGVVSCVCHDDRHPSLSLSDGDDGRLLVYCHAGCNPRDVLAELRRRGLIADQHHERKGADWREVDRTAAAHAIWHEAKPAPGTLVETYLRARRITAPIPPSIRFHPALKHRPINAELPAFVAAVQGQDGQMCAIHRTFLAPDGSGKAVVRTPKMALGTLGSGAVRLGPPGPAMGLGEGIETALSAAQLFCMSVWAALGSRLAAVALPAEVAEVHLFADNGEAGAEAARKAAERFSAEGRRVFIRRPRRQFPDWNDALPYWHQRPAGDWEW